MSLKTIYPLLLVPILMAFPQEQKTPWDIKLEGGAVWFSRNDARIPGDTGTQTDLTQLTGTGPDASFRGYVTYAFNDRHSLRLTLAPLEVEGSGILSENVQFQDIEFKAGESARATYRFNTYRLTYRWMFHDEEKWKWGVGAALLVRDAEIGLSQNGIERTRDDLGVVPLLHVYGQRRISEKLSVVLDVEGAWSPAGRAVDAALQVEIDLNSGWYAAAGYRTLEGGADNDDVYTFAWLHYAQAAIGRRF